MEPKKCEIFFRPHIGLHKKALGKKGLPRHRPPSPPPHLRKPVNVELVGKPERKTEGAKARKRKYKSYGQKLLLLLYFPEEEKGDHP